MMPAMCLWIAFGMLGGWGFTKVVSAFEQRDVFEALIGLLSIFCAGAVWQVIP